MDEQLIEDLTNYLEDDAETARMIPLSVKRAIRSFKKKRNYPSSYSDEKINSDMENCYDCIFDLALFFLVNQKLVLFFSCLLVPFIQSVILNSSYCLLF